MNAEFASSPMRENESYTQQLYQWTFIFITIFLSWRIRMFITCIFIHCKGFVECQKSFTLGLHIFYVMHMFFNLRWRCGPNILKCSLLFDKQMCCDGSHTCALYVLIVFPWHISWVGLGDFVVPEYDIYIYQGHVIKNCVFVTLVSHHHFHPS